MLKLSSLLLIHMLETHYLYQQLNTIKSTLASHVHVQMISAERKTHIHTGVCVNKFTTERIFTDLQIFMRQLRQKLYRITLSQLHEHQV